MAVAIVPLVAVLSVQAQISAPTIIPASPPGTCSAQLPLWVSGGALYTCVAGVPTALTSGTGVTSISWTMPSFMSASPTTISAGGSQTFSFNSQLANLFLASPSGASGVPAFRALANADFPSSLAPTFSATNLTGTIPSAASATTATTAGALSTTGPAGTFWGSFGGTQQYAAVPTPHMFDVTSPVFGGICNGTADDTSALALATTAANGAGGTIYIPPVVGAVGVGAISGSTMTITSFTAGTTYYVGQVIFGAGIPTSPPTTITAIPSGGGVGNYTLSLSTLSIGSPITITGYTACMTSAPLVVTNANLWIDGSGSIMASASIPSVVQWGSSTIRNNNHKIYGTGTIDTNNLAARAIDLSNYSVVEVYGILVYHSATTAAIEIGDTSNNSSGALIHNITVMNPAGSAHTTGIPGIWAHLGTDTHMDDITVIGHYYGVQNSVHNNLPFSNIHVWGFGTNAGWTGSNLPYTCFLDSFGQQTWAHDECDTAIEYGLEAVSYETVVEDFLYYNNATWGSNGFVTGIEFDQTAGLGVVNGARFIGQSGHALKADVTVNGGNSISSLQIFGVNESSYVNQENANVFSTGGQAAFVGNLTGSGTLKFPSLEAASATNCLQIDTAGNITNTGTVCATPGTITGMLAGYIPIAATGTTIVGNAHLNDGVTTTNTLTATEAFAAPSITDSGLGSSTQCVESVAGVLTGTGAACGSGGSTTWPSSAGIAVYAGSNAWGTSLAAPAGTIVGTTDTQTLTNKSVNGVTLSTAGAATNFLNQAGGYTVPAGTYTLPTATSSVLGGVKPDGTTITNTGGAISVTNPFNPTSVAITGGTIDGSCIGCTTPAAGTFTSVTTSGTTPGAYKLVAGTGSIAALPANSAGFAAPATGGTSYLFKLPATIPGAGILHNAATATADGVNESAVTSSAVSLTADVSGILPVANGGTGTASPGIVAGTNVTVTGTWPNQTINASGGGGITPTYNTASSSTNTNIAATTMVTPGANHDYLLNWTSELSTVGVACTGSTIVTLNAIFQSLNGGSVTTEPLATLTIAANGVGTLGFIAQGSNNILAKSGTAVQYSTTSYTAGAGCTTNPSYILYPTLVQLW